jgi:hypothetical protein
MATTTIIARWFLRFSPSDPFLQDAAAKVVTYIREGLPAPDLVVHFPASIGAPLLTDFLAELEAYARPHVATGLACYICGGNLFGNGSGDVIDLSPATVQHMRANPDFGRTLRVAWKRQST